MIIGKVIEKLMEQSIRDDIVYEVNRFKYLDQWNKKLVVLRMTSEIGLCMDG